MNTPHGIAIDAQDNIYAADRGNRRVQMFDIAGEVVRQITIDMRFDPNARPIIGNRPDQRPAAGYGACGASPASK